MDKIEARAAELNQRARGIARRRFQWLTETQLARIAHDVSLGAPFSTFREEGWSRPQDEEFVWQLETIESTRPDLIARAPSVADLTADLLSQPGAPTDPVGKLTLAREVGVMSDDERLAKAQRLQPATTNLAEPQSAPPHQTNSTAPARDKRACDMDQPELNALIEQRTGQPTSGMLTSKVRTYSEALIEASRPTPSPAIAECKAKLAAGRTWSDISPTVRMGAEREARQIGKSLRELIGVGP